MPRQHATGDTICFVITSCRRAFRPRHTPVETAVHIAVIDHPKVRRVARCYDGVISSAQSIGNRGVIRRQRVDRNHLLPAPNRFGVAAAGGHRIEPIGTVCVIPRKLRDGSDPEGALANPLIALDVDSCNGPSSAQLEDGVSDTRSYLFRWGCASVTGCATTLRTNSRFDVLLGLAVRSAYFLTGMTKVTTPTGSADIGNQSC